MVAVIPAHDSAYMLSDGDGLIELPVNPDGGLPSIDPREPWASSGGEVDWERGFDMEISQKQVERIHECPRFAATQVAWR
jgi:hypothetical protein